MSSCMCHSASHQSIINTVNSIDSDWIAYAPARCYLVLLFDVQIQYSVQNKYSTQQMVQSRRFDSQLFRQSVISVVNYFGSQLSITITNQKVTMRCPLFSLFANNGKVHGHQNFSLIIMITTNFQFLVCLCTTVLKIELLSVSASGEQNKESLEICYIVSNGRLQPGLVEKVDLSISSLQNGEFLPYVL